MASSTYNQQLLATVAAAQIYGAGSSPIPSTVTFGCSVTRFATGVYKVILPTGEGQADDASFTRAQPKSDSVGLMAVVTDESVYIKTVRIFDVAGSGTEPLDADVEVVVDRSTINP